MWSYLAGAGGLAVGAINLGLGANEESPEQMIGGVLAGAGVGTFTYLQIHGGALARQAEILGCERI